MFHSFVDVKIDIYESLFKCIIICGNILFIFHGIQERFKEIQQIILYIISFIILLIFYYFKKILLNKK